MAASLYTKKRYPPVPVPGSDNVESGPRSLQEPESSGRECGDASPGYVFVTDLPGGRLCRCPDGGAWVYIRDDRG